MFQVSGHPKYPPCCPIYLNITEQYQVWYKTGCNTVEVVWPLEDTQEREKISEDYLEDVNISQMVKDRSLSDIKQILKHKQQ